MRMVVSDVIRDNDIVLMRKLGYSPHENFEGKVGFVRRTSGMPFPRFHIYPEQRSPQGVFLNMHFDAKRESYEGSRTHSLEKEGEVLEEEARRIYTMLRQNYTQIALSR